MAMTPTMMLINGNTLFDLENPDPKKIDFEDIAATLSRIKRWCGRGSLSISVAQHSVYVMTQLPERLQLAGLMHDAHEAYTGDISTPMKRVLRSIDLTRIQNRIDEIIHEKLGLSLEDKDLQAIKQADLAVCASEMYRSFGYTRTVDKCLTGFPKPAKIKIAFWTETHAKNTFLQEFYRLTSPASDSTESN